MPLPETIVRGACGPLPELWTLANCFDCGDVTAVSSGEIKGREGVVLCRSCVYGLRALSPARVGFLEVPILPFNEGQKDEAQRIVHEVMDAELCTEPDYLLPGYFIFARIILTIRHWFGNGCAASVEAQAQKDLAVQRGAHNRLLYEIAKRAGIEVC